MTDETLREIFGTAEGLTDGPVQSRPDLERVTRMMARWWDGWSLTRIACEHGLSRQRASIVLNWAGCTTALWRKADRKRADSRRRAPQQRVAEARHLLAHRLAHRLTARQRCALLWQAQGLIYTDIARRMGTSAQSVRYFLVGARWRMERLARAQCAAQSCARSASEAAGNTPAPDVGNINLADLDEYVAGLAKATDNDLTAAVDKDATVE